MEKKFRQQIEQGAIATEQQEESGEDANERSVNEVAKGPSEPEPKDELQALIDQQGLTEVRKFLKPPTITARGWKVVRKPKPEWKQETQLTTDSPIDKIKDLLRSFSKKAKEAREANEELIREFNQDREKYPQVRFNYKKGAGVEGRAGKNVGIFAHGFAECSGLVIQVPKNDGVAIIHISPNTIKSTFEGGEIVQDNDIWGHTRSALKELLNDEQDDTTQTENGAELSQEDIAKLQEMANSGELRFTLLAGEDDLVPHEVATALGNQAKFRNLPFIKTDIYDIGSYGGDSPNGNSIYANPESIYFLGSDGTVLKHGQNFPPTIYNYEDL